MSNNTFTLQNIDRVNFYGVDGNADVYLEGVSTGTSGVCVSGSLLVNGDYMNFGTSLGTSGHGFRSSDSGGSIQFKHFRGEWTTISGASVAGINKQIQFNNNGNFGACAGFTFDNSTNNFVVGANDNTIITSSSNAVVIGGVSNQAYADTAFVAGGFNNSASGTSSAVVGGFDNSATGSASGNVAGKNNTVSGIESGNLAGEDNIVSGTESGNLAGEQNTVTSNNSGNVSGENNTVSGNHSGNLAGRSNSVSGVNSANIAGRDNTISTSTEYSVIAGGVSNQAYADMAFVAGGFNNTVSGTSSAVVGGFDNSVKDINAGIFVGSGNTINIGGYFSGNIAGQDNTVTKGWAANVAGSDNTVSGSHSGNLAGRNNTVGEIFSGNLAGENNTVSGNRSANVAGRDNTIATGADYSAIAGGVSNQAYADMAFVAGGFNNSASGTSSAVIGGFDNSVFSNNTVALGGEGLSTQIGLSWERMALAGAYNNYSTYPWDESGAQTLQGTCYRFLVGSGDSTTGNNAFAVDDVGNLYFGTQAGACIYTRTESNTYEPINLGGGGGGGGGTTPPNGPENSVQFNSGSAFAGTSSLQFFEASLTTSGVSALTVDGNVFSSMGGGVCDAFNSGGGGGTSTYQITTSEYVNGIIFPPYYSDGEEQFYRVRVPSATSVSTDFGDVLKEGQFFDTIIYGTSLGVSQTGLSIGSSVFTTTTYYPVDITVLNSSDNTTIFDTRLIRDRSGLTGQGLSFHFSELGLEYYQGVVIRSRYNSNTGISMYPISNSFYTF